MELEWKCEGNGMEKKWALPVEVKSNEIEWKWKGIGMERLMLKIILTNGSVYHIYFQLTNDQICLHATPTLHPTHPWYASGVFYLTYGF